MLQGVTIPPIWTESSAMATTQNAAAQSPNTAHGLSTPHVPSLPTDRRTFRQTEETPGRQQELSNTAEDHASENVLREVALNNSL